MAQQCDVVHFLDPQLQMKMSNLQTTACFSRLGRRDAEAGEGMAQKTPIVKLQELNKKPATKRVEGEKCNCNDQFLFT